MFVALDVETANADVGSICQVGIAAFDESGFVEGWKALIDPEEAFDGMNISVHGITEDDVEGAPTFPEIAQDLSTRLASRIVVCHTAFDRSSIGKAAEKYSLAAPSCRWLDSSRVARRVWEQFAQRDYGLANVAQHIGFAFEHHDALEDARAAGHIILAAMQKSGLDIDSLIARAHAPLTQHRYDAISLDGDPDGPLFGEKLVFTGALTMPRREAAALAAKLGCTVLPNVTKKATLLVVGDQDMSRLAGHEKSIKHRKAEELIRSGMPIRIIKESDFQRLLQLVPEGVLGA